MNIEVKKILIKMCECVGTDPEKVDFNGKEGFYLQHSWTLESQKEFEEWMINRLLDSKAAREAVMRWPRKNRKNIESVVQMFVCCYGWKIVDNA